MASRGYPFFHPGDESVLRNKKTWFVATMILCGAVLGPKAPADGPAKNVILMVADGAGFNTFNAVAMYLGRWDPHARRSKLVYDGPGWHRYACTTYPLSLVRLPFAAGNAGWRLPAPGGGTALQIELRWNPAQTSWLVYHPDKAWDTRALLGISAAGFRGYTWLRSTPTDSAAAATALASGIKTYNGAINWSAADRPLLGQTLAEIAKARGKAVGVVTTVPWSHATPAGLGGTHNRSREAYAEIANEMLTAPYLDLIMGAGHPEFDNNGRPLAPPPEAERKPAKASKTANAPPPSKNQAKPPKRETKYVGGPATWLLLRQGKHPAGWRLIQTREEFQALAEGKGFPIEPGPSPRIKLLGTAQAATTLQQRRGKYQDSDTPFSQPLNPNLPSLATMVRGALRALSADSDGFYLAIEGGAVDWANHSNQAARMVEEQVDFLRAVETVVQWVETYSRWDETLVIITADHETGLIWGPQSDRIAYQPIEDRGEENLPGLKYNSTGHSNSLVPLYARGPGSQRLAALVDGQDPTAAAKWGFSGQYVDNTDIFIVCRAALDPEAAKTKPPTTEAARSEAPKPQATTTVGAQTEARPGAPPKPSATPPARQEQSRPR